MIERFGLQFASTVPRRSGGKASASSTSSRSSWTGTLLPGGDPPGSDLRASLERRRGRLVRAHVVDGRRSGVQGAGGGASCSKRRTCVRWRTPRRTLIATRAPGRGRGAVDLAMPPEPRSPPPRTARARACLQPISTLPRRGPLPSGGPLSSRWIASIVGTGDPRVHARDPCKASASPIVGSMSLDDQALEPPRRSRWRSLVRP